MNDEVFEGLSISDQNMKNDIYAEYFGNFCFRNYRKIGYLQINLQ